MTVQQTTLLSHCGEEDAVVRKQNPPLIAYNCKCVQPSERHVNYLQADVKLDLQLTKFHVELEPPSGLALPNTGK